MVPVGSRPTSCAASRVAALLAALAVGFVAAAPAAQAASIGVSPPFKSLTCNTPACDDVAIQVTLDLGEIDADSFAFDIHVSDASLIGLAVGSVPGNPIPGMNGSVTLLGDGTTLRGLLDSLPSSFDGPATFDVAILPLHAVADGTVELRFLSAEIACTLCNGGAGEIYSIDNTANQLIGTIVVVPEPGTAGLLALGIAAIGVVRRRTS